MNPYLHLNQLFSEHLQKFSQQLSKESPAELYEPCNYMISLGGKRLRPLLALVACDLFEHDAKLALNSALAVELFHNFSLIHDDILDEAPLRRNQTTVHLKWNRNIAILSGDALLVKSLQVLHKYDVHEAAKLSELMCVTATQVCEGQQLDMNFETQKKVSIEEYIHMIQFKTAVLLGCSLKLGAINAGASPEDQKNIYDFGMNLGIAFQLLDDLLDAFALDVQNFGKRIGGDILSNKKTYLLLKALELASNQQHQEIQSILQLPFSSGEDKILRMLEIYKHLNIQDLCQKEADFYTQKSFDSLDKIELNPMKKKALKQFAAELLNRQT